MTIAEEVVKQAARGDRSAQQAIYEHSYGRLFSVVRRIVGPQDAEDVVHDVFLQIFRKLHSFQFDSSFTTWAYRLAVNEALQQLRTKRRRPVVEFKDNQAEPIELGRGVEQTLALNDAMERAMAGLEPELQVILQLKEVDRMPYEEIAKVVGIPVGTVGSRLNRARRELRDQMQRMGWEG